MNLDEWGRDWEALEIALRRAPWLDSAEAHQLGYDLAEVNRVCEDFPPKITKLRELLGAEVRQNVRVLSLLYDVVGELSVHLPDHLSAAVPVLRKLAEGLSAQLKDEGLSEVDLMKALERARKELKAEEQ